MNEGTTFVRRPELEDPKFEGDQERTIVDLKSVRIETTRTVYESIVVSGGERIQASSIR
jgi:hypothetical protein